MSKTKVEKTEVEKTEMVQKKVDKQAFIARKLSVLNQKSGAKFERSAARVIENNQ